MTSTRSWDDLLRFIEERDNATGWLRFRYDVEDTYRRLRHRARDLPHRARWAYQRVVRGWDDRAVWSLDDHLARTLGAQLVEMADIAHGYPSCGGRRLTRGGDEVEFDEEWTFESWTAALRGNGDALIAYAIADMDDPDLDETCDKARDALRWVADNLPDLWD